MLFSQFENPNQTIRRKLRNHTARDTRTNRLAPEETRPTNYDNITDRVLSETTRPIGGANDSLVSHDINIANLKDNKNTMTTAAPPTQQPVPPTLAVVSTVAAKGGGDSFYGLYVVSVIGVTIFMLCLIAVIGYVIHRYIREIRPYQRTWGFADVLPRDIQILPGDQSFTNAATFGGGGPSMGFNQPNDPLRSMSYQPTAFTNPFSSIRSPAGIGTPLSGDCSVMGMHPPPHTVVFKTNGAVVMVMPDQQQLQQQQQQQQQGSMFQ